MWGVKTCVLSCSVRWESKRVCSVVASDGSWDYVGFERVCV